MSSVSDAGPEGAWRRRGACGGSKWTPVELLAMVLGFMVYWPIGLGLIGWKVMQRRKAFEGPGAEEWLGALREKFADFSPRGFGPRGFAPGFRAAAGGFGGSASGNAAFDAWRRTEIERLEEERRKLEKAQQEFAEFVEEARKSKDREEFERFMNRRGQG